MKRTILTTLSLLAACSFSLTPLSGYAAEKGEKGEKKGATAEKAGDKADNTRPIPYTGKVTKVDEGGKSFTLSGKANRVIQVTDTTEIKKDGATAAFTDIAANEEVRGQATKAGDKWTAVSVTIGAKEKAATEKKEKGDKAEKKAEGKAGKTQSELSPATVPASGAGSPNSSSAGPAVNGVAQPGGEAPAGAKKN